MGLSEAPDRLYVVTHFFFFFFFRGAKHPHLLVNPEAITAS